MHLFEAIRVTIAALGGPLANITFTKGAPKLTGIRLDSSIKTVENENLRGSRVVFSLQLVAQGTRGVATVYSTRSQRPHPGPATPSNESRRDTGEILLTVVRSKLGHGVFRSGTSPRRGGTEIVHGSRQPPDRSSQEQVSRRRRVATCQERG